MIIIIITIDTYFWQISSLYHQRADSKYLHIQELCHLSNAKTASSLPWDQNSSNFAADIFDTILKFPVSHLSQLLSNVLLFLQYYFYCFFVHLPVLIRYLMIMFGD